MTYLSVKLAPIDQQYRSTSRENPLWWTLTRADLKPAEFLKARGKYLIYGDHKYERQMRELCIYLIDRYKHFIAAKVSKYAIDGEKLIVLLSPDNSWYDELAELCKVHNFLLYRYKHLAENIPTDHERDARDRWGNYITNLSKGLRLQ
jgi:hypothetical protein